MFQLFATLSVEPNDQLSQEIHDHLKLLRMELMNYFPDLVSCTYAVNPLCIDPTLLPVKTGEQEEIIDIQVKIKTERMLSHRFLANHGFYLPNVGPKCCSTVTDFPIYMGI